MVYHAYPSGMGFGTCGAGGTAGVKQGHPTRHSIIYTVISLNSTHTCNMRSIQLVIHVCSARHGRGAHGRYLQRASGSYACVH